MPKKKSIEKQIEEIYSTTWKDKDLTKSKRHANIKNIGRVKQITRWLSQKGKNTVKSLKTTFNKTPKFVSLILLGAGFIRAGIDLAQDDIILAIGVALLSVFLIREASK